MQRIVIASGYFNPVHKGHIEYLKKAKQLGDFLVVIVSNDKQVTLKGSVPFMDENERMEIIKSIRHVDEVFLAVDNSVSIDKKNVPITESLKLVAQKYSDAELIFAKGGDRNINNIPQEEREVCEKFNIKVISNVGGNKVQSSSTLIKKVKIS